MIRASVDIGGTFTDVQLLDPARGVWDFKAPTTPADPSEGLIAGLRGAAARAGVQAEAIGMILHGSTIATNAVLERRLPKGALLTTSGFQDVLAIGRHMRRDVYALMAEDRPVLIPTDRRIGVVERIRADGTVETPLDLAQVARLAKRLVAQGVQTVAVMFLHGFRNPVHEQAAAQVLADHGLVVSTSHETSPEIREYERASTTVLNALLKPVISDYLDRVESRLRAAGIQAPLYLVHSNGGIATPAETARLPVRMLLSGPAGGAMAVADLAGRHAADGLVGLDMGGTSTDVCVVRDGRVQETQAGEIDGLPVRLPMVEIRTIGAGGGSVARAETGALRVGPNSAGARPGPACYGHGGAAPTVTDANLALGLIDPDAFLGGAMRLDVTAAHTALADVAAPLGLTAQDLAAGITDVANAAMADAVRLSLFEKGADPGDHVLVPFGGAGGLHACAIAEALDMRRILFPATASTLSARGSLASDLRHDLLVARLVIADDAALPGLARDVGDLRSRAEALLDRDGIAPDARRIEIHADMRYRGQAYELTTPWMADDRRVDAAALVDLRGAFHQLHQARFAHSAPGDPVEIVSLRARAIGLTRTPELTVAEAAQGQATGLRSVWLDGAWQDVPVHARGAIRFPLDGPALIQEDYAILWIRPGWTVAPAAGDLIAKRKERS